MTAALLLAALTFPPPITVPPGAEVSIPAASPNGPAVSLVLPFETADDRAALTSRVEALEETVASLIRAQVSPAQAPIAPRPQTHGCLRGCECKTLGECGHSGCACVAESKPKAPPPPTVYRLADRAGQVWTHTDPAWLATYVAQRNAAIAAPAVYGGCAGGSCYRR